MSKDQPVLQDGDALREEDMVPRFDYCCHGIERRDCEQCSRTPTAGVTGTKLSPDAMRDSVRDIRDGIATLPEDAFGFAHDDANQWPIRDEVLAKLNAALSPAPVPSGDGIPETRLITEQDREYASELLADLANPDNLPRLEIAAQWFRKARVEQSLLSPSDAGAAEPVGWRWSEMQIHFAARLQPPHHPRRYPR